MAETAEGLLAWTIRNERTPMTYPAPEFFPGTLYDGDGKRLAGAGPDQLSDEMNEACSFKALLHDRAELVTGTQTADRIWVLPATLGSPPQLPNPLLVELAAIIRNVGMIGIMSEDPSVGRTIEGVFRLLMSKSTGNA